MRIDLLFLHTFENSSGLGICYTCIIRKEVRAMWNNVKIVLGAVAGIVGGIVEIVHAVRE